MFNFYEDLNNSSTVVHCRLIRSVKFATLQIDWAISQSERRTVFCYFYILLFLLGEAAWKIFDQLRHLQPHHPSTTFLISISKIHNCWRWHFQTPILFSLYFSFFLLFFCSCLACVLGITFCGLETPFHLYTVIFF